MTKEVPIFDERKMLAVKLGLPKIGGVIYDWFSLPWETIVSWLRWEDDEKTKRVYLTYDPPIKGYLLYYYYFGSIYYDYKNGVQNGYTGKDLEVNGLVKQCYFGVFCGKGNYTERLVSPKNGIFVNLLDMSRFEKTPHTTPLNPGESIFYIDYSFPSTCDTLDGDILNKLRDLKKIRDVGVNAGETLKYLLEKYGIFERDL